jgi:phage shock protein C
MAGNRPPNSQHGRRPGEHRNTRPGYRSVHGDHSLPPRTRRLYRDPRRGKIGGVCAGIAAYYGVEPWVVRCIAVTGLLFFPSIVFPAYWIAYFLMDRPPADDGVPRRGSRGEGGARYPSNHSSPAPEFGSRLSPRNSLRDVQADLAEAELRLRRMERHVTSGQYELRRELNKIDGGAATPGR